MKKIFLIILSFFIITTQINANWDRVSSVNYRASIGWDISATVTTINKACPTNTHIYSWSIKNILNAEWNNNNLYCQFKNGNLICQKTIFNWGGSPKGIITEGLKLNWSYYEVFKKLWVPEKIISNTKRNFFSIQNNIDLWLTTSSNGSDNGVGINKNFNLNKTLKTIEYYDESECQPKMCFSKDEIQNKMNKANKIEDKEKREKELDNIKNLNICQKTYIENNICDIDSNWKCLVLQWQDIRANINPWKIKDFKLEWQSCLQKWNDFFCFASDNLDFSFWIESDWDGIDTITTSINNNINNAPAYPNNNHNYNIDWVYSGKTFNFSFWWDTSFTKTNWIYTIVLQWNKWNNPAYWTNTLSIKVHITPTPNWLSTNLWKLEKLQNNNWQWWQYANLKDTINYRITFKDKYWNNIDNWNILSVEHKWFIWIKNIWRNWDVNLISYNPGTFFENFEVKIWLWNQYWKYIWKQKIINIPSNPNWTNYFLAPIKLEKVDVYSKSEDWRYLISIPEIWKEQKYKFILKDKWLKNASISNWNVDLKINNNNFIFENESFKVINLKNIITNFQNLQNSNISLIWILNIFNDSNILSENNLRTKNNLEISYNISNNWIFWTAKYNLNQADLISMCKKSTLWAKIIWNIQSNWKANITGQKSNFTDLSTSDLSAIVIKNANNLTRNLKSWDLVNWVKYVEWNFTIENENPDYETLIVKNWNLFINKDLNKSLWIIVLNNKFNIKKNNSKWNIYIANNVENINAFIYADWAIKSAKDYNWTPYEDKDLSKSLNIKWNIFSKNTIWWAIAWEENIYYLPNGEKTEDFKFAEKFDLNFIRKVPANCVNWVDLSYNIKIEYDQKIQTNPPKWFTK